VIAIVLGMTGVFLYLRFRADLNDTIGRSLRTRGDEVTSLVRQTDDELGAALRRVAGADEDFAQVLGLDGNVVATTPHVSRAALLTGEPLRRATQSTIDVEHAPVAGLDGRLRMRAAPVDTPHGRRVVVVGTTLGERDDSLRTLAALLGIGGTVALLLSALAGYGVAAGALRPVDSMRRQAATISPAEGGRRLDVPPSRDEIARLGQTLNEMLDRLEAAFARERAFVADASHELRTPLGILKAELDLALRRGRSPHELQAAIASAAEETDRLAALAEDLLVIARLDQGRLPIRSTEIDVSALLAAVAVRFEARARDAGRVVRSVGSAGLHMQGDRARLEQALGNMVDNALRHGAGEICLSAIDRGEEIELHVSDEGGGFAPDFIEHAFERFARADGARTRGGTGLGLAIVAAIAASHGGRARAASSEGDGADVWLELPHEPVKASAGAHAGPGATAQPLD
jgi:signal transduction histidine kinase